MLNEENTEGRTMDNEDEATTNGRSHHPASPTSSIHNWLSALNDARRWTCKAKNIDWVSRRIFPATFTVFNIIYWSVYLSPPHVHCDLASQGINLPCFNTT